MQKIFNTEKTYKKIIKLSINKFEDHRGDFLKLFTNLEIDTFISKKKIKQINLVTTKKRGTIRGLHYQIGKFSEYKVFHCIKGEVLVVCVDVLKNKKKKYDIFYNKLSERKDQILIIPPYFATGYQTLKDKSKLLYFSTAQHNLLYEKLINPLDTILKIKWPLKKYILSVKDSNSKFLKY